MDDTARLHFLTAQVESLVREKEAALTALEAASRLGHFDTSYTGLDSPAPILQELAVRVRALLPMPAAAVYLIDEQTQDMVLCHVCGDAAAFDPEAEIDALIADHSFSFALGRACPTFFEADTGRGRLVLHPLATPSRVRGMFLGLVDQAAGPASDTALALFSVVINAGAQALESFALYRHMRQVNAALEDTVARRTAELRQAYDQVRVIVDSLPAGVVVIDPADHRILDINPAGLAMLGQPRESVVGSTCFDCFCPAQRGMCPMVDGGQELVSVERTIACTSGRTIPILKTAVRANLAGRPCIIESFTDISEQKKLAELREDVERMTRHDLKSPLTGIIGLPDVLLDDPGFPAEHREFLGMIKEAGLKMLGMINLSLDLYKMETGTYALDPRPVDLAGVLGSVVRDLGPYIRGRQLEVVFETDGREGLVGPMIVLGETLLYVSLFSNLLKNAVEASPHGGTVQVSLVGRDRVWAAIHNAGTVPEAVRDRFFEKYATSGKAGGTGLGAYSARLIVENLGGAIDFLSGAAEGTTLFLSLPRPD
jgi:PAS domain S-box-containing protein